MSGETYPEEAKGFQVKFEKQPITTMVLRKETLTANVIGVLKEASDKDTIFTFDVEPALQDLNKIKLYLPAGKYRVFKRKKDTDEWEEIKI